MKISHMNADFILYCCLHCGPVNASTIDEKCTLPDDQAARNKQFLTRVVETYGSCGMLVEEKGLVIAHARFYPHFIHDQFDFCCHDPNHMITEEMVRMELPRLEKLKERSLRITCFFVHADYRGQGLSHKLIAAILEWAKANEWQRIRCFASYNNHFLASEFCTPMLQTYKKFGFKQLKVVTMPELTDFLEKMKEGEFGKEKKEGFEKYLSQKNISDLVNLYEMECRL